MKKGLSSFVILFIATFVFADMDKVEQMYFKQLKSKHPEERAEAAWKLGEYKVIEAAPDLIAALGDRDQYVRANAAAALWSMEDAAKPAIPALKNMLANDPYGRARVNAANTLWKMDLPEKELIRPLQEVARGEDAWDAVDAADSLIRMGLRVDDLVPVLERGLHDPDVELRKRVIDNIGDQKKDDKAYIPILLDALQKDPDETVRSWAALELGDEDYSTPEVAEALRNATKDKSETVRSSAASSLKYMKEITGDNSSALLAALKDKKTDVREDAANSLGERKKATPEIVNALIAALSDKDKDVREAAAESLGELEPAPKEAIAPLWAIWNNFKEDTFVRHAAGRSLGNLGETVDWKAEEQRVNKQ